MKTTGDRIRELRIEKGITQDELAKMCGFKSRSSINKLETQREITLKHVKLIASALNCTPEYLLGWADHQMLCPHCGKPFTVQITKGGKS